MNETNVCATVWRAENYRRVRWKNHQGWTREIVRSSDLAPSKNGRSNNAFSGVEAQSNDDWLWRLSVAEIEQDAAFSAFPGIDRELILLSGNGLRLRFGDNREQTLQRTYQSLRFPGECAVQGELIDGATTDLNIMWQRGLVHAQYWHRPLVGTMAIFVNPGDIWAVYLGVGRIRFSEGQSKLEMAAGDTMVMHTTGSERGCRVINGAGEGLFIKISDKSEMLGSDLAISMR